MLTLEDIQARMDEKTSALNKKSRESADILNASPCAVCGSKEFIQLYRNVVGKIEAEMCGSFSLFGGSVYGSIDGSTQTLPILSCRNCGNERTIETYKYHSDKDILWEEMYDFYFGISREYSQEVDDIHKRDFISSGWTKYPAVAVRQYMKDNQNWHYDFYNQMVDWSPATWASMGFDIGIVDKKFLWFKWQKWPTWDDLAKEYNEKLDKGGDHEQIQR